MSWDAVLYVRKLRSLSASEKAVLYSLASRLDPDDGRAWPSLEVLAQDAGMSRRNVRYVLARLRQQGLVDWEQREDEAGDPTSHRYRLPQLDGGRATIAPPGEPVALGVGQPLPGGGEPVALGVGQGLPPKQKGETTSKRKRETTPPSETALTAGAQQVLDYWSKAQGRKSPPKLNPAQRKKLEGHVVAYGVALLLQSCDWAAQRGLPELDKALNGCKKRYEQEAQGGPRGADAGGTHTRSESNGRGAHDPAGGGVRQNGQGPPAPGSRPVNFNKFTRRLPS